jgi:hypothetical protein
MEKICRQDYGKNPPDDWEKIRPPLNTYQSQTTSQRNVLVSIQFLTHYVLVYIRVSTKMFEECFMKYSTTQMLPLAHAGKACYTSHAIIKKDEKRAKVGIVRWS